MFTYVTLFKLFTNPLVNESTCAQENVSVDNTMFSPTAIQTFPPYATLDNEVDSTLNKVES